MEETVPEWGEWSEWENINIGRNIKGTVVINQRRTRQLTPIVGEVQYRNIKYNVVPYNEGEDE